MRGPMLSLTFPFSFWNEKQRKCVIWNMFMKTLLNNQRWNQFPTEQSVCFHRLLSCLSRCYRNVTSSRPVDKDSLFMIKPFIHDALRKKNNVTTNYHLCWSLKDRKGLKTASHNSTTNEWLSVSASLTPSVHSLQCLVYKSAMQNCDSDFLTLRSWHTKRKRANQLFRRR